MYTFKITNIHKYFVKETFSITFNVFIYLSCILREKEKDINICTQNFCVLSYYPNNLPSARTRLSKSYEGALHSRLPPGQQRPKC